MRKNWFGLVAVLWLVFSAFFTSNALANLVPQAVRSAIWRKHFAATPDSPPKPVFFEPLSLDPAERLQQQVAQTGQCVAAFNEVAALFLSNPPVLQGNGFSGYPTVNFGPVNETTWNAVLGQILSELDKLKFLAFRGQIVAETAGVNANAGVSDPDTCNSGMPCQLLLDQELYERATSTVNKGMFSFNSVGFSFCAANSQIVGFAAEGNNVSGSGGAFRLHGVVQGKATLFIKVAAWQTVFGPQEGCKQPPVPADTGFVQWDAGISSSGGVCRDIFPEAKSGDIQAVTCISCPSSYGPAGWFVTGTLAYVELEDSSPGGTGPNGKDGVGPYDRCESLAGKTDGGPRNQPTHGDSPVSYENGAKYESDVDLELPTGAGGFRISRQYSSDATYNPGNLVGNRWGLSVLQEIAPLSEGASVLTTDLREALGFTVPADTSTPHRKWKQSDGSRQYLEAIMVSGSATEISHYSLIDPGKSERQYFPAGHPFAGKLKQVTSEHGWFEKYDYVPFFANGAISATRLNQIVIGVLEGTSHRSTFSVQFEWDLNSQSSTFGKLSAIRAYRMSDATTAAPYEIARVFYSYHEGASVGHAKLGDLIEVRREEIVDGVAGLDPVELVEPYWSRVTQYRYYTDVTQPSSSDERLQGAGAAHQLKMVIRPEQIEFAAQRWSASGQSGINSANRLRRFAQYLRSEADDAIVFSDSSGSVRVVDMAAKIVGYDANGRVASQFLQSACGCSGASQGTKLAYSYLGTVSSPSCKIQTFGRSGTTWSLERIEYADLYRPLATVANPNSPVFVRAMTIEDPSARRWTTLFAHDVQTGDVTSEFSPAACAGASTAYQPASASAAATMPTGMSVGLARKYTYSDRRLLEMYISEAGGSANSWKIVERIDYADTDGDASNDALISVRGRSDLPVRSKRYRGTSTLEGDIETRWFAYYFGSVAPTTLAGTALRAVATTQERELLDENGPPGSSSSTVTTYELFSTSGLNTHSVAANGAITFRKFDESRQYRPIGAVETLVANAGAYGSSISTAISGCFAADGASQLVISNAAATESDGELVYRYWNDEFGRTVAEERPGNSGVGNYTKPVRLTVRELRPSKSRPGLLYLSQTDSGWVAKGGAGPMASDVAVSLVNAAGVVFEAASYPATALDSEQNDAFVRIPGWSSTAFVPSVGEPLVQLLPQASKASVALHHLSGLTKETRTWTQVSADWWSGTGVFSSAQYEYDSLGRSTRTVGPDGGVVENASFDALGRVLETRVGRSGTALTTVAKYFYDSTGPESAPAQGVGNGNLTVVHEFTGETATGLSPSLRITRRFFDGRDRLTWIKGPTAPFNWFGYDNQDRLIERALYSTIPSGSNPGLGAAADRGLLTRTSYSQRGLVYRSEVAINPTSSTPAFLRADVWRDSDGRVVATRRPDQPVRKMRFNGRGAATDMWITDGAESSNLTPGGELNLGNDAVIEHLQLHYSHAGSAYPDGNGQPIWSTHWKRIHDANVSHRSDATHPTSYVRTFAFYGYDLLRRKVVTVGLGTNAGPSDAIAVGGSEPTDTSSWQSSVQDALGASTDWFTYFVQNAYDIENAVISGVDYDAHGRRAASISLVSREGSPVIVTDRRTRYFYDDADRLIATNEAASHMNSAFAIERSNLVWNAGSSRWDVTGVTLAPSRASDRLVSYAYDSAGRVAKQVMHAASIGPTAIDQVTEYAYGTDLGTGLADSLVNSSSLLREVIYPDETTGLPGSTNASRIRYAYNALGELRSLTDQNGTRHLYRRDSAGRVTEDAIDTFGVGIDSLVNRLTTSYDAFGRATSVRSFKYANVIANEVTATYTPLWQIEQLTQNAYGSTGSDPTRDRLVEYVYDTAAPNGVSTLNRSRLGYVHYPTVGGNSFDIVWSYYGLGNSINDRISRPEALVLEDFNYAITYPLASYDYLGLSTHVVTTLGDGSRLDRRIAPNGSVTQGVYPGFDRFGRVKRQTWVDGVPNPNSSASHPKRAPLFDEGYTYNAASDRLSRFDARPGMTAVNGVGGTSTDFDFVYDTMGRLQEAKRGKRDAWAPPVGSGQGGFSFNFTDTNNPRPWLIGQRSQQWSLSVMGNWDGFNTDLGTDGLYTGSGESTTRTHNAANELLSSTAVVVPYQYDDAGNVKQAPAPFGGTALYKHDAWNRLVEINWASGTTTTTVRQEYNGLHWRTKKSFSTSDNSTMPVQKEYTYDAAWRMIQCITTYPLGLPGGIGENQMLNAAGGGGGGGSGDENTFSQIIQSEHLRTGVPGMEGGGGAQAMQQNAPGEGGGETGSAVVWTTQQFWGLRYIDDAIARRTDYNNTGFWNDEESPSLDEDLYWYLTDAQFSVRAVLDPAGRAVERITYDAYGNARCSPYGDLNGDGMYNATGPSSDLAIVQALAAANNGTGTPISVWSASNALRYNPDADLDRTPDSQTGESVIDQTDVQMLQDYAISGPATPGRISVVLDNEVGYCGYLFNDEYRVYTVRYRHYSPESGRWLERDPIGYEGGLALMEYAESDPTRVSDAFGLKPNFPEGEEPGFWDQTFVHGTFEYYDKEDGKVYSCQRIYKQSRFGSKVTYVGTRCRETGKERSDIQRPLETQRTCDEAIRDKMDADRELTVTAGNSIKSEYQDSVLTAGAGLLAKGIVKGATKPRTVVLWSGGKKPPSSDLGPGEEFLNLPENPFGSHSGGSFDYWPRNEAAIRDAAEDGAVFRDSYVDAAKNLIRRAADTFIERERALLQSLGYEYSDGYWRKAKPCPTCPDSNGSPKPAAANPQGGPSPSGHK